jgi:hypothetical protein
MSERLNKGGVNQRVERSFRPRTETSCPVFQSYAIILLFITKSTKGHELTLLIIQNIKNTTRKLHYVGFEVLTVVVTKLAIFWDIASCNPYVNRRLRVGLGWFYTLKMEVIRSSGTLDQSKEIFKLLNILKYIFKSCIGTIRGLQNGICPKFDFRVVTPTFRSIGLIGVNLNTSLVRIFVRRGISDLGTGVYLCHLLRKRWCQWRPIN